MMRVLHVVKTSDGASWAASQAEVLVRLGIEVHVALPSDQGRTVSAWRQAGAHIHIADLSLPLGRPHQIADTLKRTRRLVDEVQPDLIHSHFVTTTLTLRLALGRNHRIPRVFQVAGPLHLEHLHTRQADLRTAGQADYWVASSRCIGQHYQACGIAKDRLFLSYYGSRVRPAPRSGMLRTKLGLPAAARIVGNISYIYPPKRFLGERVGLKGHEELIDALAIVTARDQNVYGVLVGNTLPGYGDSYERTLRKRALQAGGGRILMPGYFSPDEVRQSWPDFDCAVHVPHSENCGGVVEPLSAAVPVIAAAVGGLPEVVIDNVTGKLVSDRRPEALAQSIAQVLADPEHWRKLSTRGRRLVERMFDVNRTSGEVLSIYKHIATGTPRPEPFDSERFATQATEFAVV